MQQEMVEEEQLPAATNLRNTVDQVTVMVVLSQMAEWDRGTFLLMSIN